MEMETGRTRKDRKAVNGGNAPIVTAAAIDFGRYRAHVAHLGLSADREIEVIAAVYAILKDSVDRAWGDDPVQHALGAVDRSATDDAVPIPDVIESGSGQPTISSKDLTGAFQPLAVGRHRNDRP